MQLQSELYGRLHQNCCLLAKRKDCLRRKQELESRLAEAKYQKREADAALTEYEWGGFRVWLDKVTGKWEDKREELTRTASAAREHLQNLQQEITRLDETLMQLDRQQSEPCSWEDIHAMAGALSDREREQIFCRLAAISAEELALQLEQAKSALQQAQEWARPNNRIDTAPGYTKGIELAKAEDCARSCCLYLQQLEQCGIALEVHVYFQNPTGYIHGTASAFGELDRINSALGAITRTEKQIQELRLQLSQEE